MYICKRFLKKSIKNDFFIKLLEYIEYKLILRVSETDNHSWLITSEILGSTPRPATEGRT